MDETRVRMVEWSFRSGQQRYLMNKAAVNTYADGEVNGHDNGAKVGCGERQSRTAHEVNGILVRAHQECPRCEEQHGADGPQNCKLSRLE